MYEENDVYTEPTETSYSLEEVAEEHEAENWAYGEDHTADTLASSLFTASEMVGHNNAKLREAVGFAQQLVGNTENLADNLKPFEVGEASYDEANLYLQQLKDTSKVCLAQAKMLKSDEVTTYRDIDRLVSSVGLADDYNKMVF